MAAADTDGADVKISVRCTVGDVPDVFLGYVPDERSPSLSRLVYHLGGGRLWETLCGEDTKKLVQVAMPWEELAPMHCETCGQHAAQRASPA